MTSQFNSMINDIQQKTQDRDNLPLLNPGAGVWYDQTTVSYARMFSLGMRKLLGIKPDEKAEECSASKGPAGGKGSGEPVDRWRAFKIEAVGLTSLWFSFGSGVLARFVVEWESGKDGCTMHVSPDQHWPHTKVSCMHNLMINLFMENYYYHKSYASMLFLIVGYSCTVLGGFAGDQVWLQPATPPKGGASVGGSLPCPQFRPFIMEHVAQELNGLEPNLTGSQVATNPNTNWLALVEMFDEFGPDNFEFGQCNFK